MSIQMLDPRRFASRGRSARACRRRSTWSVNAYVMKFDSNPARADLLYNIPMPLASIFSYILLFGGSGVSYSIPTQKFRTAQDDYEAAGELLRGSIALTLTNTDNIELLLSKLELSKQTAKRIADAGRNPEAMLKYIKELEKAISALPTGAGSPTRLDFDRAIALDFEPAWRLVLQGNRNPKMPTPSSEADIFFRLGGTASGLQLTKIAVRKARFELASGNGVAALRTFHEAFRFTQRLEINCCQNRLSMVACEGILFAELESSLAALPSQGLSELIQTINHSISGPSGLQIALAGERILQLALTGRMEKNFEGEPKKLAADDPGSDDDTEDDEEKKWNALFDSLEKSSPAERRAFFQNARSRYGQIYNSFGGMLSQPEHAWNLRPDVAPAASHLEFFVSDALLLQPEFTTMEAEARTRCRIAAITLAAREFAWQHGRYPTDLSEFLTKAEAHDPLNNKPFEYAIEQGNIVVKTAVHPILGQITLRKLPADPAAARRPKRP